MDAWTWLSADGIVHAITYDRAGAHHVDKCYRHRGQARVYSLNEIIRVLALWHDGSIGGEIKDAFPGSEIAKITVPAGDLNDDPPF